MSPEPPLRPFASAEAIARIGEGLLARDLPKSEWTHEAHLAACLWILRQHPEIVPERDLPAIISGYNEAVGGTNSDSAGYHETLTQLYIRGIRAFAATRPTDEPLLASVNALLTSAMAPRDWPLAFYSGERLFSAAARRTWVEPDLAPLPTVADSR